MKYRSYLLLTMLLLVKIVLAQRVCDTNCFRKYNDRLIISVFQSYRNYSIDITQKEIKDSLGVSKISYLAEANLISGIELNYDKLNISFGFKSKPPDNQQQKGNTKYKNFVLNIGGNQWIIENSYRSYKGFYNKSTGGYDTSFKRTGIYTQIPSLNSELYKTKFLFFTNANKFSFKSGYSCTYRQLKTAFSFVLSGNLYYNRLNSDSSFIPYRIRNYYDSHKYINGLNVFAFSVYGGGSVNLVLFKAICFNLTLVIGPENQWRKYSFLNRPTSTTTHYTSISGDFRASMGLNLKKFFLLLSTTSDFSWYNTTPTEYLSKYYAVNFSIGYRFKVKPPKYYERFQQTKFYEKL